MFDEITILSNINPPLEVKEQVQEPFIYNGLTFTPKFKIYNNKPYIQYYFSELKNLYVTIRNDELTVFNSWHKFFKGNNYSDYYLSEIRTTGEQIQDYLKIKSIKDSTVLNLAYGCNIFKNPEDIYNNWLFYKTKNIVPMIEDGKQYGAKVITTDYSIKGYNKTFETKKHSGKELNDLTFRFEIEARARHLRQRGIIIYSLADLYKKEILLGLMEDTIRKFKTIIKRPNMNLTELKLNEIRDFAIIQIPEYKEHFRKHHNKTYKRMMRRYRECALMEENSQQERIIEEIRCKFLTLIEN